jgi:hypothetical protein
VLDLVQPRLPARRLRGFGGQAGRDETGRQKTHIHGRVMAGGTAWSKQRLPKMGHAVLGSGRPEAPHAPGCAAVALEGCGQAYNWASNPSMKANQTPRACAECFSG